MNFEKENKAPVYWPVPLIAPINPGAANCRKQGSADVYFEYSVQVRNKEASEEQMLLLRNEKSLYA